MAIKAEFPALLRAGDSSPAGLVDGIDLLWARLASLVPNLANLIGRSADRRLLKRIGGVARSAMPRFAARTADGLRSATATFCATPTILWPDTFNNHFHPEVAQAAVEVLEDAGIM